MRVSECDRGKRIRNSHMFWYHRLLSPRGAATQKVKNVAKIEWAMRILSNNEPDIHIFTERDEIQNEEEL